MRVRLETYALADGDGAAAGPGPKSDPDRPAPGIPETYHNIWHCQKS